MTPILADAHVHVDFMANAAEVVRDARKGGIALFANTVTPRDYLAARATSWAHEPNVRLGLGMHPWWVADGSVGSEDVDLFCQLARECRYVGEVGLDFSDKHTSRESHEMQVAALRAAFRTLGSVGGKVVSIHSVRSADVCLDLLEESRCLGSCSVIFHWFSGSTEALWRAIRAGCYFSINEMQARTRRAREQLRLVPRERLLLETDLPPGRDVDFSARALEESLETAANLLSTIRGEEVLALTSKNAWALLA